MGMLSSILNFLFPSQCLFCREKTVYEPYSLCATCWNQIVFRTGQYCHRCRRRKLFSNSECDCVLEVLYCDNRSVVLYNDFAKKLIWLFKYHRHFALKYLFIKWISIFADDLIRSSDVVIPVPLHKIRMQGRGYNQSFLLASLIAKKYQKECIDILLKTKNTVSQNTLSGFQRTRNVVGTFEIELKDVDKIKDKNVLIIDDVITTGSTLAECAKIIKRNGGKEIRVVTVATT